MRIECAIASLLLFTSMAECQTIDPESLPGGGVTDQEEFTESLQSESDRTDQSDSILFNPNNSSESNSSECLNDEQTKDWLSYEKQHGTIIYWEELFVLSSFDRAAITCLKSKLQNVVSRTHPHFALIEMMNASSVQITQSLTRAFIPNPTIRKLDESLGDPWRAELRLRISDGNNYKLGINLEKDPGEIWWNEGGPDHLGYFLQLHPKDRKWKLTVGDFEYKLGQGLLAGSRVFGDFLTDPGCLASRQTGIRPHSSMYEADYCRGAGFSWKGKKMRWQLGISTRPEDGTIKETEYDGEKTTVFTTDRSGLHAVPVQVARNNSNYRTSAGSDIGWEGENTSFGLSVVCWKDRLKDIRFIECYSDDGTAAAIGFNGRFTTPAGYLFGEGALGTGQQRGGRIGWICQPDRSITTTILYSFQEKGPLTPYSLAATYSDNEAHSTLIALSGRTNKKLDTQAFLESGNSIDANGYYRKPKERIGLRIQYRIDKKNSTSLMLRRSIQDLSEILENGTPDRQDSKRIQISMKSHLCPLFGVELDFRAEFCKSRNSTNKGNGYLFSYDLHLNRPKWPVSIDVRFSFFRVTDYSAAIRTQEYDIPYHSSRLLAYGTGQSSYVVLKPKLRGNWKCWLKWSSTTIYDRLLADSSDSTWGNRREILSLQITRTWFSE